MADQLTILWDGKSGREYRYWIYEIGHSMKQVPGSIHGHQFISGKLATLVNALITTTRWTVSVKMVLLIYIPI